MSTTLGSRSYMLTLKRLAHFLHAAEDPLDREKPVGRLWWVDVGKGSFVLPSLKKPVIWWGRFKTKYDQFSRPNRT